MTKAMHRRFGMLLGGSIAVCAALSPHPSLAAGAACLSGTAAMSPEAISSFMADPSALLERNPLAGQALANEVRSLVASDVDSGDSILALAAAAPPAVQRAIGRGLAAAAQACVVAYPELAALLQEKVAASGIEQIQASFAAASEDVATAALEDPAAVISLDAEAAGESAVPIGGDATTGSGGSETGSTAATGESASAASESITNPSASSGGLTDGTSFLAGLAATDSSGDDDDNSDDGAPLSPTR